MKESYEEKISRKLLKKQNVIAAASGRKKAEIRAELAESPLILAAGFAGKKLFIGEISVK